MDVDLAYPQVGKIISRVLGDTGAWGRRGLRRRPPDLPRGVDGTVGCRLRLLEAMVNEGCGASAPPAVGQRASRLRWVWG